MTAYGPAPSEPVLLIDDDSAVRTPLAELLALQGYSVVEATDGAEALSRVNGGLHPCAILLDLWMPGMDGITFLERRRADPELSSVPVIVLSAFGDAPGRCVGFDIQGFLIKPVRLSQLFDLLSGCLH